MFIWFQELRYQIGAFQGMTKWSWPNDKIIITTRVYLTHGPSGPNPSLNGGYMVLSRFSPRLRGHVSTREEEGQGSGSRSTWPAAHVARPAGRHLATYRLGQVGGAPPWPYKYPPPVEIRIHTPHFGNCTCKTLILSAVARRNLVGRVVRLWGSEGLPACQERST
jgi:hypothetical protein